MQSRLFPSHLPLDSKGLATVSRSAAFGNQPAFEGTIASACDFGIGIDNFIRMTRSTSTSDPRIARFLDAWEALGPSEQQARGAADTICEQEGLAPVELLKVVADATYRYSMYAAQFKASLALPSIVERSIEVALTDKGVADRKMLLQHAGFLPIPVGSQTHIAVMQNATAQPVITAQRPEDTIRRLSKLFNESQAKTNGGSEEDDGKQTWEQRQRAT